MKSLHDHLILFDEECPMCRAYTKSFTHAGMLPENGRLSYQTFTPSACVVIDRQRAANEIALVHTRTGEVTYGIKSLFKVIGHSFPLFKPLFNFGPFIFIMSKIYAFISYNRRVIIPAEIKATAIQPTFRLSYRMLYLIITWLLTATILNHYTQLFPSSIPKGGNLREYIICGGQMLFQGLVICFFDRNKLWDYLGNLMTISFGGALLLCPVIIASWYISIHPDFFIFYFLAVAGLMFLEHMRRTRVLKITFWMTISWMVYRLILLSLILILA